MSYFFNLKKWSSNYYKANIFFCFITFLLVVCFTYRNGNQPIDSRTLLLIAYDMSYFFNLKKWSSNYYKANIHNRNNKKFHIRMQQYQYRIGVLVGIGIGIGISISITLRKRY